MAPPKKKTPPAMTPAAIRKLVKDGVDAALATERAAVAAEAAAAAEAATAAEAPPPSQDNVVRFRRAGS